MEPTKPQKSVLVALVTLLAGAWGLIIWIATVVTQTMLDTLAYIVDLSQMTP